MPRIDSYVIIERIDKMLLAGRFIEIDIELASLDVDLMTIGEMLAWLTITAAARSKLFERAGFYTRVAAHLGELQNPRLLDGLE